MIGLAASLLIEASPTSAVPPPAPRPRCCRAASSAVATAGHSAAVPGAVLAVEVAAGVALAARVHALRAVLLELGVDQRRDRLVGRRPVAVAAAEDAVLDPGEGIGGSAGSCSHWQNFAALSGGWPL